MKQMKTNGRKWAAASSLGLLGVVWATTVACGDSSKGGSLLDTGGSSNTGANNTGATSTGGSGIHLGDGGDGTLPGIGGVGTDPSAGGADCGSTKVAADPPVVNVLVVVDKSLSMDDKPTGFATTKWAALQTAMATALGQTKAKISYGLDLYPYSGTSGEALTDSCQMPDGDAVVVPVQAGTKSTPLILAALKANPPSGGTPTAAALARADAYFTTGDGKALKGEKYVLLATDGGPNCNLDPTFKCDIAACTVNMDGKMCGPAGTNCCDTKVDKLGPTNCLDEDASVAAVKALAKHGIKTFVVGIPGTEAYATTLDALAAESGIENPDAPPAYFAVSAKSGAAGLSSVLERITTGLVTSCRLQLQAVPPVLNDVYVVIDGVEVKHGDADGWDYDDSVSPPAVVIKGATCDKLETDGAQYINVSYGCPDFDPPK
jgi:hypothetical protein